MRKIVTQRESLENVLKQESLKCEGRFEMAGVEMRMVKISRVQLRRS